MNKLYDSGVFGLYELNNDSIRIRVSDLGATLVSLQFRGKETVLGYDSIYEYLSGTDFLGASIGRYGNRIAGAAFTLGGVRYTLPANEGRNQLHGGPEAFDKRRWEVERQEEDALRLTLLSPDGDNGFPGNLRAAVTYRLLPDGLRIEFEGESDRDTVFAPTNHSYFDLGAHDALAHELFVNADRVLSVDNELIPLQPVPVRGKFDLRSLRTLGEDLDHCFPLKGEHAVTLRYQGLHMDLYTDFPAVQIYTGAGLHAPWQKNSGVAIEPEFYPNSPNRPDFPSTTLRAGEHFFKYAEYRFTEE